MERKRLDGTWLGFVIDVDILMPFLVMAAIVRCRCLLQLHDPWLVAVWLATRILSSKVPFESRWEGLSVIKPSV
jgi:hypothetical protein